MTSLGEVNAVGKVPSASDRFTRCVIENIRASIQFFSSLVGRVSSEQVESVEEKIIFRISSAVAGGVLKNRKHGGPGIASEIFSVRLVVLTTGIEERRLCILSRK